MRSFVFPSLVGISALVAACSSTDGSNDETYSREKLLDPSTCNECHQSHYKEWSGSMHAYSSEDPVFRAMNARGQEETNGELGDFCVKCHAPMAVAEGVTTDGLNLDSVPKQLQGVTCYFCHNVQEVTETHNNPLVLANDMTMRGAIRDPVKYRAHKSTYASHMDGRNLAQSSKMCGACHDIVVPGHFSGAPQDVALEQTYAEWQTTVFAVEGKSSLSCGECHMNAASSGADGVFAQPIATPPDSKVTMPVRSTRHEHLFAAIDTAHGDFPQKDVQATRIAETLDQSIRVQLCVAPLGGSVDVIVENQGAGHGLPSGASADRRMWAEIHVFAGDRETYQNGVMALDADIAAENEKTPFFNFWDKATKLDGSPAHMFWEVANLKRDAIPGLQPGLVPAVPNARELGFSGKQAGTSSPTKVTVTVWLEPLGRDLIADLRTSGHLTDETVGESMPRYALLPQRLDPELAAEDKDSTLTWHSDPKSWDFTQSGTIGCVETSAKAVSQ